MFFRGSVKRHFSLIFRQEFPAKSLSTFLKENGDVGKQISYLKMDIEGLEMASLKNWLKSGIFSKVDQFGIEWHTGPFNIKRQFFKVIYGRLIDFYKTLLRDYGMELVAYNPNLCPGKEVDGQRIYYSYLDVLFVNTNKKID